MKKITSKTLLKQGDKIYQPVEVNEVIYWCSEDILDRQPTLWCIVQGEIKTAATVRDAKFKWIVAQSLLAFEDVPLIDLNDYAERLALQSLLKKYETMGNSHLFKVRDFKKTFKEAFESNTNKYTQKDLEKAIDLARENTIGYYAPSSSAACYFNKTQTEILEEINNITFIEVDESFNIISYD